MAITWKTKPESEREIEGQLAEYFKALGHPARVRILRTLLARETCGCGDLVDVLPLAQSTVSQHLKVLKDAGLISGTADGPRRSYGVDRSALNRFRRYVGVLQPPDR